jgi:RNase adapter protein RapZ
MNTFPDSQEPFPVLIITGLSGSGKSTALRALEDIGYFCIDNLPIHLVPKFLELRAQITQEDVKVAFGMDARTRGFVSNFLSFFKRLQKMGYQLHILFLEAGDDILIRRFSQTRRQHPLAENEPIVQAIQKERKELNSLRNHATRIIDTSNMTVHNLRLLVMEEYSQYPLSRRLNLHIISFGFKYGLPPEADIIMDVRFLPNPYFIKDLKELNGLEEPVQEFVLGREETREFLGRFIPLLDYLIPNYQKEGKTHLTVAVGCSGGHHRSVVIANTLEEHLQSFNLPLTTEHRDIARE